MSDETRCALAYDMTVITCGAMIIVILGMAFPNIVLLKIASDILSPIAIPMAICSVFAHFLKKRI